MFGLAQDEADVRIGNQEALAVDDVGHALVADLDPRHDVPDEFQIDFGDRHRPAVAARPDGDRHVRLGLLAEVHGTDPRLAPLGAAKGRFLRAVLARTHDVHAKPRNRDLLASGSIELRDVGDFGHLAQELQEFDAAQLDVAGIELRERGIGQLLLDLANVLLDARRCRDRLLLLQIAERGLVLLIREIDADRARREQGAADQREDEKQVFAKQPALSRPALSPAGASGPAGLSATIAGARLTPLRITECPRRRAASSLNQLVRAHQHRLRNRKAKLLGGLAVEHELEAYGLEHGQLARLGAFQNAASVNAYLAIRIGEPRNASLNHLVRPQQQRLRDRKAEGRGRLAIHRQLVGCRALDREIGGLGPAQYAVDVERGTPGNRRVVGAQ